MSLNQEQLKQQIIQAFSLTTGMVYVAQALSQAIHNYVTQASVVTNNSVSSTLIGINGNVNIFNFTDSVTGVVHGSLTSMPLIMKGSTQGQIFSPLQENGLTADLTQFRGRLI